MHDLLPLSQIRVGGRAEVIQVLGDPEAVHRLEELGVRSGAKVEMVQCGSPFIVKLNGGKLCFRGDDLFAVLVRPE